MRSIKIKPFKNTKHISSNMENIEQMRIYKNKAQQGYNSGYLSCKH